MTDTRPRRFPATAGRTLDAGRFSMLLFELVSHWLLTRLAPPADDGLLPVAEPVDRPRWSLCPAPLGSSAVCRHARWARFNRPPRRPDTPR
ncbi:MAG: hypothetical protein AAFX76_06975 [Planctomycetota bacterium]